MDFTNMDRHYKPYDDFFALVRSQGEHVCYEYDENAKRDIINDFIPVLTRANDPLLQWLEDILATAKLREVRVFPKEEWMYVRVEVMLLDANAEWRGPYQLVALWDCFNNLKGWTFVAEGEKKSIDPDEIWEEENELMRQKRAELRAARERSQAR